MPEIKPEIQTFAKIKVIGVGGGGGAAINRMIESDVKGVEFVVINTDLQALQHNLAERKLHIGRTTTRGLGAGMDPTLGRKSAEESQNELRELLKGTDLLFITCGLGGGSGSGASPVLADIAKEMGILTIAVVTKPFSFEGGPRRRIAEEALKELSTKVDTLITIPNDRIWQLIDKKTPLVEAFRVVDEVLRQGVQGIAELITLPGLINVDFADVRAIMRSSGSALMGVGLAQGDNRAIEAAKAATSSPLLEVSIEGARGLLFTIAGNSSLTMYEVSEAAKIITESVDPDAKIIFGAVLDERLKDSIKITVVATGFDEKITKEKLLQVKHEPINYFQAPARVEEPDMSFGQVKRDIPVSRPVVNNSPVQQSPAQQTVNQMFQQRPVSQPVSNNNNQRPMNNPDSMQSQPQSQNQSDSTRFDDEDLEIPTFIRKKMM